MRTVLNFLALFIATNIVAQPGPGHVFREYIWLPEMVAEQGKFLRVGGKLDYKSNTDHFPADKHKSGYIPLIENLNLKDAIKAEMIVEKIGSHEDTKNLRVSINGHPSILFPKAEGITEPQSDYMQQTYPLVNVPLNQLNEGMDNSFRFDVDSTQRWNWPQNIIYGVVLRVYYKPEIALFKTEIGGISENGILSEGQKLGLLNANQSIRKVEFIGKYEDINWEGDGIFNQWHYHFFRGELIHHIGTSRMYPFEVTWNTNWIPDQENISIAARIVCNDGLIYFTEAIDGLKLNRGFSVKMCKPYDQPKNWVTREGEFTSKFDLSTDVSKIEEAKAFWVSWSPCYANGVFINDREIFERNTLCYEYMAHEVDFDPTILKQGTNIIKTGKEPLHDGQMVHGMEVQWPGIMVKVKTAGKPGFKAYVQQYEGRDHFVVEKSGITYFYDIRGGGFSRILDEGGNDWVSFKMEPWGEYPAAAASAFRGLPNMVFQEEDDGAGHPGHDKCTSYIHDNKIVTESLSGKWKWQWSFLDDYVVLDVLKTDMDRAFWFLYEGTPGGGYDPAGTYFGTDHLTSQKLNYDYYKGNVYREKIRWMYVGTNSSKNVMYFIHKTDDTHPDMVSLLGNSEAGIDSKDGMTVIAFGRGKGVERYLTGAQQFIIGFYPGKIENATQHKAFSRFVNQTFKDQ